MRELLNIGYLVCVLAGLYIPVFVSVAAEKINITPLNLALGLSKRKKSE